MEAANIIPRMNFAATLADMGDLLLSVAKNATRANASHVQLNDT
jgi:hypothetical protein